MKKINALMLGIALAFGISTTSCNKNDTQAPESGEKQVQVKVDLGTNNRASELTGFIKDKTALEAEKLDIYITDGKEILRSERIESGTDDWNHLTSDGLKFLKISSTATNIIVIANSGEDIIAKGGAVSEISKKITLSIGAKQVLGGSAVLEKIGVETQPGVVYSKETNTTIKKGTPVSTAKVTVRPIISRFQIVGVELMKRVWNNETTGKDFKDATTEEKAKKENYKLVPDENAKLVGILLNRFYNESELTAAGEAGSHTDESLLHTLSYVGSLTVDGGSTGHYNPTNWSIIETKSTTKHDVTAMASYLKADGYTIGDGNKVAAFNFFANGLKAADNNTPKIHFVISKKNKESKYDLIFANITGYKQAAKDTDDIEFGNGKLYNINLSSTDKTIYGVPGTGAIITESEMPGDDDVNVTPDISKTDINIVATVTVAKWVAENVKPVFEK